MKAAGTSTRWTKACGTSPMLYTGRGEKETRHERANPPRDAGVLRARTRGQSLVPRPRPSRARPDAGDHPTSSAAAALRRARRGRWPRRLRLLARRSGLPRHLDRCLAVAREAGERGLTASAAHAHRRVPPGRRETARRARRQSAGPAALLSALTP